MDLFDEYGHLTQHAFWLLSKGEPDELQRLEIAEHLSYCDECVERYTQALTEDVLISPEEPLWNRVIGKIKSRARKIFMNRYATAAVAACFAMVLWTSGAFSVSYMKQQENRLYDVKVKTSEFSYKTQEFTQNLTNKINYIFENINLEGVFKNGKK